MEKKKEGNKIAKKKGRRKRSGKRKRKGKKRERKGRMISRIIEGTHSIQAIVEKCNQGKRLVK